jgi:transposase
MVERRVYTEEFKREAVRLAQERGNRAGTARELGVSDTVLSRWTKRLGEANEDEAAFPGQGNPRDAELARLKRENARLEEENLILKKAVGIFTNRPR